MRRPLLPLAILTVAACRAVDGGEDPVITYEIVLPKTSVPLGQPVGVNLRMTNPSTKEVVIRVDCSSSFTVHDSRGRQVYPFPADVTAMCISPDEPLAAGASRTRRLVWATHRSPPDQTNGVVLFVDPGEYEIRASARQTLSSRDVKATPQRVTLVLPPG